ncbi:hypothetical protein GCM10009785_16720 [Brooklawnia cerclae]|uniref:Uncharacterized protein n=1 Tax=Brooklawnia cerclae TaxID=349934 RepID=A0ABX0SKA8_9ACTN|nr:hypothetical protein [Brooklawnia cerclae]NIH57758.1 hypothetical protein [Brooklawnia cerclae]
MRDDYLRRFRATVAALAMASAAWAALIVRTPASAVDRSNLVTFLAMFPVAGAVTSLAGRWPSRIAGCLGGLASVTGVVGYLASAGWAPWVFAGAAIMNVATLVTTVASRGDTRRP